jgi:phage terminase small subunit
MKSKAARVHRRHSNAKVDPMIAAKMHTEGKSMRVIARELGVSRMAVARAIRFVNQRADSKSSGGDVSEKAIAETA